MRVWCRRYRRALWLGSIVGLTAMIWLMWNEVFSSAYLSAPPAIVFFFSALFARSPYGRWVQAWAYWPQVMTIREDRQSRKDRNEVVALRFGFVTIPYSGRFSFFRAASLFVALITLGGSCFLGYAKQVFAADVVLDPKKILRFSPIISTRVLAFDGDTSEEICLFVRSERRNYTTIDRIPIHVRQAFIAAEDQHFLKHHGIDPPAIARALIMNFFHGATRQGGSTITQQVIKQVVLRDTRRSYIRKIRELILAPEFERRALAELGSQEKVKERILEAYLNQIFLGENAYGIDTASQIYFGHTVEELTIPEAAILAGLPKAPSRDSPIAHFDRAKQRQGYVLSQMRTLGFISEAVYADARTSELARITKRAPLNTQAAPYFCEMMRKELIRMYGEDQVYTKGLIVVSTLDMRMQRAAEAVVRTGLLDLDRRIEFHGPEGHDDTFRTCVSNNDQIDDYALEVGHVLGTSSGLSVCVRGEVFSVSMEDAKRIGRWEEKTGRRLATGDVLTVWSTTLGDGQRKSAKRVALVVGRDPNRGNRLQAAIVAVDPTTGELRAHVGGYDFLENQFDNAAQAHRQTGSSIKPYVYLTALRYGLTVIDTVNDHPVCYPTASGVWCPRNYVGPHTANQYMGMVDLRTALAKSLNSVSVQLLERIGQLKTQQLLKQGEKVYESAVSLGISEVIATMRSLGIVSDIPRIMPLAVGAVDLTPYEHTFAYASIAAQGKQLPRHPGAERPGVFIRLVTDQQGNVLYRAPSDPRDMWPQAVPAGSAYALLHLMRGVVDFGTGRRVQELRRPAAGKTGTTNNFRDVWFMGFTADLVVGTWIGRTTPRPVVKEATGGSVALPLWLAFMKEAHPKTPPRDFPVPTDVLFIRTAKGENIPFARGTVPTQMLTRQ